MSSIDILIDNYYKWLRERTIIQTDKETNWSVIQTPFDGIFNDSIEIYIKQDGDKILLSDNGDTLSNLDLIGLDVNRSKGRREFINKILLTYGINQKNNEFTTDANESNFNQKKHNFLSAIIEINDLYVLSKNTISSLFKEDVRDYLDSHSLIYTPDFISRGLTGLEFNFDFQLAYKDYEIVVKSFNSINKTNLSQFLFSWEDIQPVREKITKKTVKAVAIINNKEKSVSSEYLEALQSKKADFILWNNRDMESSLKKLKAS